MKNKTKTIIAEMLPFIMADGSQEAGEHEFSPNEIAMHGTMMICDATCNEIRACMMESLGFQHRGNDEGMEALIERMLEVKPYRFCQERLKQGDLRQLLSNPSFLREAHRRWASQSGFQSGPILAKAPDWGKLQKEATSDLTTAAATAEEVVQAIEENKGYCFRTAYSMLGNM